VRSARDIAVDALRDRAGNVSARLDRLLAEAKLSPADESLARELALGSLRRRRTLEAVLKAFLRQPGHKMSSPLPEIFQIALYQLLFLDRIPDFAAVNEAVEQAARYNHRRQGGFVNGVLRTIARSLSPAVEEPPPRVSDVIPLAPRLYRRADKPIFPDAAENPAEYLVRAYSLPPILARRWLERYGLEPACSLAMHANVRPPMVLRVNRLKATQEQVLAALAAEGAKAFVHANGQSVVLEEFRDVRTLGVFRDGLVHPQDASATAVCMAAAPRPATKVLDFCASPGTKTTQLAELMQNRGEIFALDVTPEKLVRIADNCRRLGVDIVQTRPAEQAGSLNPRDFDLVLVDAPCSYSGSLARRPEARWRFDGEQLAALAKDQVLLTLTASEFVRPGGRLVYCCASIEPEEGEDVVAQVLRRGGRLKLERQQRIAPAGADEPARWSDGGFYAIFQAK
jgi:16S rRNA (cytosine967-C5)-methyltransferase